mmetsp:Transcript_5897/g.12411  ORF Transcript_5897/g.12411 Transcript_5897/m.12411 type:complete len:109 (+) Transcript_5897:42-368(+)
MVHMTSLMPSNVPTARYTLVDPVMGHVIVEVADEESEQERIPISVAEETQRTNPNWGSEDQCGDGRKHYSVVVHWGDVMVPMNEEMNDVAPVRARRSMKCPAVEGVLK